MHEVWHNTIVSVGDYSLAVGQLSLSLFFFVSTFIVASLVAKAFKRMISKSMDISQSHLYVIARIVHYLILALGLVISLSTLGIDMGKLALVASALGIGIGLGLQGIVNNFVSGLAILFERSIKVGDFIELASEVTGEVIEVHMRATLIRTNDNVDILIPNAEICNGQLINWTLVDNNRRFRIPFSVAYGSDKAVVKQAVLEAANNVSYTLTSRDKEPVVWMTGFGDSSLNFSLGVWVSPDRVKKPTALMSDYLWAIDDSLRKYNIEIPFPQRDLHIRSDQYNASKIP
jgi:small-conductance mechanosensitive channel